MCSSSSLANGLVTGSVIAIAAVGVSLVYGILRLVNFAYGDLMAFGALVGVALQRHARPADGRSPPLLAMVATAVLSVALEAVLWRPLRARGAGFMSLFLASIGLALVLRQVLLLVAGPQSRTYDVDPYKVYVIGSVRLSGSQAIAIVVARRRDRRSSGVLLAQHRARADDARRSPTTARSRRSPASTLGRVIVADVDRLGPARGARGRARRRSCRRTLRPELRLPAAAADLRRGRARRDRQRLRRARSAGSLLGARDGALDLAAASSAASTPSYKPVVAFVVLIGVAAGAAAGALRAGARRVSTLASGEFWAFVGVVAGIYTIFALGLQLSSASRACSTSARSRSWRSAPTRWRSSS